MAIFVNRQDAGKKLVRELQDYARREDVVVLGLPRGGVPVAYEVAKALNAPLDVFLVRKLGVPGREELAMGAIASGGERVLNDDVIDVLDIPQEVIDLVARKEEEELERRERAYRGEHRKPDLKNKTVILVDDGLATGASMRAAVVALRRQDPKSIVVAVPTAAPETCEAFEDSVEDVICAITPQPFYGVGYWYQDFSQTTDEEVRDFLEKSRAPDQR